MGCFGGGGEDVGGGVVEEDELSGKEPEAEGIIV